MARPGDAVSKAARRSLPKPSTRVIVYGLLLILIAGCAYLKFGRDGKSDTQQVREVTATYVRDLADNNNAQACALLTADGRAELVAQAKAAGVGTTCVTAMAFAGGYLRSMLAQIPAQDQARIQQLFDTSKMVVTITPDGTSATASPFGRPIDFAQVDGHWLVDEASTTTTTTAPKTSTVQVAHGAAGRFAAEADAICKTPAAEILTIAKPLAPAMQGTVAAPADTAGRLREISTLSDALGVRLSHLHAPASETTAFAHYLKINTGESAELHAAVARAKWGQRSTALKMFRGLVNSTADKADRPALHFQTC